MTLAGWSLLISIGSLAVVLVVGVMAYKAMKDGVRDQNLLTLARDIQSNDQRTARGLVYELGKRRVENALDVTEWSQAEIDAVERTCQLFELALFMEQRNLLPSRSISEPWVNAIERCWAVASPLIARREKLEGATLWVNFQQVGRSEASRNRPDRPSWLVSLIAQALTPL